MRQTVLAVILVAAIGSAAPGQDSKAASDLRQYYSGKFGFYSPGDGLNNGLLFGVDGITEFIRHSFFLSGAIDLYFKQTFGFFRPSSPDVTSQSIVLLPLHANFGYQVFDVPTADTRGYVGIGGGYYLYFYSVDYRVTSGLLGIPEARSATRNGGNVFGTFFARVLIGKIFVEPRYYIGSKKEDKVENHTFVVDPAGFAITLGFQY